MKTSIAFEHMARALPYVSVLLNDEAVVKAKVAMKARKEDDAINGKILAELMPTFLIKKPDAVYGLLGAVYDKKPDEIAAQDLRLTIKQLESTMLDELMHFFIFAVRMANYA